MLEPVFPQKDTLDLRAEVIDACRRLADIGFCIGTWGNVSVRVDEGVLVTPSKVDYFTMSPDDLVVVSWEGKRISGERLPTSEVELHRTLLARRPDLGCIIHTHSPYASSVSAARMTIPVTTEDMAQIIGGKVRCAEYVSGALHTELAESAWVAMGEQSNAVLLANHGPVVGGRDIEETFTACRVLEKAAQIFVHATSLGNCTSIPEEMVREERYRFVYKYGKE